MNKNNIRLLTCNNLYLLIGLKISRKFYNQWEANPKPIAPCTRDFSRSFSKLKVIARDSHSVVRLYARVVIGRSNYFRVSTIIRKLLYEGLVLQVGRSSPFKRFAFLYVRLVRSNPDPNIGRQKTHSLLLDEESFCLTDNWAERHWRIPGAINIQKISLKASTLLLSFSFFSLKIFQPHLFITCWT